MIELAPGHKLGFGVASPVLLAGGTVGLGEALPVGLAAEQLGAVVVGPLLRRPRAGASPPRLATAPGQLVLATGLQNRGLTAARKRFARYWARLNCPVVVQLADGDPHTLATVAAQLTGQEQIGAFELLLPTHISPDRLDQQHAATTGTTPEPLTDWLTTALRELHRATDLPIWVKLPLAQAGPLATTAVGAGAVGLVVGQPPVGALPYHPLAATMERPPQDTPPPSTLVTGALLGPALFPLMLAALVELAAQQLPAALIACGGIHSVTQARQALAAGAHAIQVDGAIWIEPGLATLLAQELAGEQ